MQAISSDQTMAVIEHAMRALAVRSEVTANNVANSEVPGFRASRVSFEAELENAIRSGEVDLEKLGFSVHDSGGDPDITGNTVSVEAEVVDMLQTNLMQQTMFEAFNYKAGLYRAAITGQ